MSRNGDEPRSYSGMYSTDLVKAKALDLLDEAMSHDAPWFLTAAPIAPHSEVVIENTTTVLPPKYADRHAHLFQSYEIPRDSTFNTQTSGAVSWIESLTELNDTVIAYDDEFQRARLRALQAVDEMVESLIEKLDASGILDNTYVFYTSDNGFHISQYRMHPGKSCGYGMFSVHYEVTSWLTLIAETDINIPLLVRGPGIAHAISVDGVSSHTNIAPTILSLAQAPRQLDGKIIPLFDVEPSQVSQEHAAIEFWGYV
jgi:N-acetylglucosamine-6-sulfatase